MGMAMVHITFSHEQKKNPQHPLKKQNFPLPPLPLVGSLVDGGKVCVKCIFYIHVYHNHSNFYWCSNIVGYEGQKPCFVSLSFLSVLMFAWLIADSLWNTRTYHLAST